MNARPRNLVHPVSGAAYQVIPGVSLRDRISAAKALGEGGSTAVGAAGFPKFLAGELDRFDGELSGLGSVGNVTARSVQNLAEIARGIHDDARGIDESFAAAVAGSLAAFVEGVDPVDRKIRGVIDQHTDALQLVAAGQVSGDGGPARDRLLDLLAKAIRKVG